jgi:hypothetical protein
LKRARATALAQSISSIPRANNGLPGRGRAADHRAGSKVANRAAGQPRRWRWRSGSSLLFFDATA